MGLSRSTLSCSVIRIPRRYGSTVASSALMESVDGIQWKSSHPGPRLAQNHSPTKFEISSAFVFTSSPHLIRTFATYCIVSHFPLHHKTSTPFLPTARACNRYLGLSGPNMQCKVCSRVRRSRLAFFPRSIPRSHSHRRKIATNPYLSTSSR